ncbi:MAG: hypothetical protein GY832_17155 [Chloroflexi bacterium]|nr:hypothetical protein [Chloroflexota bacterium]
MTLQCVIQESTASSFLTAKSPRRIPPPLAQGNTKPCVLPGQNKGKRRGSKPVGPGLFSSNFPRLSATALVLNPVPVGPGQVLPSTGQVRWLDRSVRELNSPAGGATSSPTCESNLPIPLSTFP